jgi:hypothetical protein
MIDVYALPSDFPALIEGRKKTDAKEKVALLEKAFKDDIGRQNFVPYLQLHEYEALLFSDTTTCDSGLKLFDGVSRLKKLDEIREQFESPEHIDEGPNTAPSKRLKGLFPSYDKLLFGPLITATIGLQKLREQCEHFDEWVTRLEQLNK